MLFLGGESNHGKTMGQIEACRRGALLVSTETTIIDEDGRAVLGSKSVFLKKRTEGTERADKAAPEAGVDKFFGGLPTWEVWTEPTNVDVVIVPAIDGNFDPSLAEMIPFERQFQTFHSVQNYFLTNELLAPGFPMPLLDRDPLRGRAPPSSSGSARAAVLLRPCRDTRRCSSTRWIGSCRGRCGPSVTAAAHPRRGGRPAARPGRARLMAAAPT